MTTVYILVGCPSSGKSTWASKCENHNAECVISTDDIREELSGDATDQSVSGKAFSIARKRLQEYLNEGHSVIIDATNMYRKTRKDFLDIAKDNNSKTVAVVFEVTKETAIERNAKRAASGGRNVPSHVIENMIGKYQRPDTIEFNEVLFISKL